MGVEAFPSRIDRIVVIHDYAKPVGGAGVLALQAAKQYRSLGYGVTFITGDNSSAELEALDIEIVALGSEGLLDLGAARAIRDGFHNSTAEHLLSRWIERHDTNATAYHLHNWSQILSPAIFRALRPVENRVVVSCHDFFNICPNGSFLNFPKSEPCELTPLSAACLISRCDRRNSLHKVWRIGRQIHLNRIAKFRTSECTFAFIHDRMKERFIQSGFAARNMATIANPVEPWSTTRIPAELNSGLLFVGRIGQDKGADIALEAARLAQIPLTMIGSGEDMVRLAAQYPEAVFTGWCDKSDLEKHARMARAIIVPSRVVEPFGLVILEAASSGLPVLVSNRAFLADDVDALGFGLSFDVTNLSQLVSRIRQVSENDDIAESMSYNGTKHAASLCHTNESWAAAYVELIEGKLSGTRSHLSSAQIPIDDNYVSRDDR